MAKLTRQQALLIAHLQKQLNQDECEIADCLVASKRVPRHLGPRQKRILRQICRVME